MTVRRPRMLAILATAAVALIASPGVALANQTDPPDGGGSDCQRPHATVRVSGSTLTFTGNVNCYNAFGYRIQLLYGTHDEHTTNLKNCTGTRSQQLSCGVNGWTTTLPDDQSGAQNWCAHVVTYQATSPSGGAEYTSVACLSH